MAPTGDQVCLRAQVQKMVQTGITRSNLYAFIKVGSQACREFNYEEIGVCLVTKGLMGGSAEAQGAVPGAAGLVGRCLMGWPDLVSGARGRVWCRAAEAGRPGSRAVRVGGRIWARALRWLGLTHAWLKL